jgi:hypothetical protein
MNGESDSGASNKGCVGCERGRWSDCPGRLVVHLERTLAFCTEEPACRACPGYEAPHPAGTDPCWLLIAGTDCGVCAEGVTSTLGTVPITPASPAPRGGGGGDTSASLPDAEPVQEFPHPALARRHPQVYIHCASQLDPVARLSAPEPPASRVMVRLLGGGRPDDFNPHDVDEAW